MNCFVDIDPLYGVYERVAFDGRIWSFRHYLATASKLTEKK